MTLLAILMFSMPMLAAMAVSGGRFLMVLIPHQDNYGTRIELDEGSELYYSSAVRPGDAHHLADYLNQSFALSNESYAVTYKLDRSEDRWMFGMVIQEGKEHDELVQFSCRLMAISLSVHVFDDEPVDFHICDRLMQTVQILEYEATVTAEPLNLSA